MTRMKAEYKMLSRGKFNSMISLACISQEEARAPIITKHVLNSWQVKSKMRISNEQDWVIAVIICEMGGGLVSHRVLSAAWKLTRPSSPQRRLRVVLKWHEGPGPRQRKIIPRKPRALSPKPTHPQIMHPQYPPSPFPYNDVHHAWVSRSDRASCTISLFRRYVACLLDGRTAQLDPRHYWGSRYTSKSLIALNITWQSIQLNLIKKK